MRLYDKKAGYFRESQKRNLQGRGVGKKFGTITKSFSSEIQKRKRENLTH